jgi:hypothetical protein
MTKNGSNEHDRWRIFVKCERILKVAAMSSSDESIETTIEESLDPVPRR